ncbi:MAG: hypothetical protein E3J87_10785 [Candidatus Cloacimonadota bacterium]|nr:MAG: hypothetical protein E3J87_10785 [Candidatus Cloacimonadota bacterium]
MTKRIIASLFILTIFFFCCEKNEPISPPPTPMNLSIDVSNGSVNLSWDEVEEADGYKIFLSDSSGTDTVGNYLDMIGRLSPSYTDREPTKAGYYHVRTLIETYYGDELSEPSNVVNTVPFTSPDSFQIYIWGTVGENSGFGWDSLGNGIVYHCEESTKDLVSMFIRDVFGGFYLFSADESPFEGNRSVTFIDIGEALLDTIRILPTSDSGYESTMKVYSGHIYGIYTDDKRYIKLEIVNVDHNSITFRYSFQKWQNLPVF